MYDNLLYQNADKLLIDDIRNDTLPGSILFAGVDSCGKLTAALETSRILSCRNSPRGKWTCTCSSCLQHKALVSSNTILLGPRDCSLEISASKKAFLNAVINNSHVEATRYLFIRSVRKLTMRFNPVLWQDSDKLSKISECIQAIDELLEQLDPPRELPDFEELEKICGKLEKETSALEQDLMYDSISISHIRNLSGWAHISLSEGKKVIIIEKAERMLEGVRNALLKILEEPPENTVFILTTSKRNSVMPTILSRVRTYNFNARTESQSYEIIERIYHEQFSGTIEEYLQQFLPVTPSAIKQYAENFYKEIVCGQIPDINELIKNCNKFDPRILLRLFLEQLYFLQKSALQFERGAAASSACTKSIREVWNNVTVFNQSVLSALEWLVKEIALINRQNDNALKEAYDKH